MPISINYNRKENVIYTKAEGEIKLDDIFSYFSSLANLELKKGYCVFADYSDASPELSNEDIRTMAMHRKRMVKTNDKIKVAVTCEKDLSFGLGRMYEMLADKNNYHVTIFRDQAEGRKWLGI